MAITKKRRIFIEEYLNCWNATEAARRAGYAHPNKQGPYLVNLGIVAAEIQKRINERAMSADEVLDRLAQQARGDIAEYMTPSGLDMKRLVDDGKAYLIQKYSRGPHGPTVEFYNSQRALELLGKHHALFTDRIQVDDWRAEIVRLLRTQQIDPEQVTKDFPSDLAAELFAAAGISVSG